MNLFDETEQWARGHLPHHRDHPDAQMALPAENTFQPEESPVTKLADAQAVIKAAADNPLIDPLIEHGLGSLLDPREVNLILGIIDTIEKPRRTPAQYPPMPPIPDDHAQQQPVQPQ